MSDRFGIVPFRTLTSYLLRSLEQGRAFGIYSGETPSTINDWITSFGKNIHIFDWEGRPLKRIRTDYRMGNLTLSESQKRLYLVYYDEEYFRFGYIDLQEDEL